MFLKDNNMRRSRYQFKTHNNTSFGLNITSMTDMFTIMLVFLLQTYSTSPVEIKPEKNLRLPSSTAEINPTQALQLSINTEGIIQNGKTLVKIEKGVFAKETLDPNDSSFILPLFNELNKISKEAKSDDVKEGRILLQADRDLPYETIRKVLYTASMAGFPKVKLATVVGSQL
jgi:biopolymer transport protein ExbD